MKHGTDVAVLGGGIIGLAVAWELARRGAVVTVFEQGEPGHAASWAAAGMLAPFTEDIADAELLALAVASLESYPSFAAELQAASGVDIRLRLQGILEVAYDDAHAARLRERVGRQLAAGVSVRALHDANLAEYDAALARESHGAAFCGVEGHVDNRRLGRALTEATLRAGVRIRRDCKVDAIGCNARRVTGVSTRDGFFAATTVVNALGAWAGAVAGVPAHIAVPVLPVKGQMLAVAMPEQYLCRVVWAAGVYLVPREDGRLLVGATVEEQGFDQRVTAGGMQQLLHGLVKALPGAASFAVSESWAGLRPGTPDGRPYLGQTRLEGYVLATGHYRNGVLLTPITARLVADDISGVQAVPASFSLYRG